MHKEAAATVLAEHPIETGFGKAWCGNLDWHSDDSDEYRRDMAAAQHQADMLAAAGLLVTAEHDAQVLRDAADARDDALLCGDPGPSAWLRSRADRIAAGEEP